MTINLEDYLNFSTKSDNPLIQKGQVSDKITPQLPATKRSYIIKNKLTILTEENPNKKKKK